MWTALRAEIERIRHDEGIPAEDFQPVNITRWRDIEARLYSAFCKMSGPSVRNVSLSACLKRDSFLIPLYLREGFSPAVLIPAEEIIYFLAEDEETRKLWYYEGRIEAIQRIIESSEKLRLFYISSKKFEWMFIYEDGQIKVVGENMIRRIREHYDELL